MTFDRLYSFLRSIQDSFLVGELEAVLEHVTLPLVIYSVAGVTVLRSKCEFLQIAEQYHAAIVARGVVSSEIEILEQESAPGGRIRLTARFLDKNALGQVVTSSLIRYFLAQTDSRFCIEMMEYLEAPLPRDEIERIVH